MVSVFFSGRRRVYQGGFWCVYRVYNVPARLYLSEARTARRFGAGIVWSGDLTRFLLFRVVVCLR